MSEAWKQWEGQIVDAKFPLRRYLGGSDHSAVFLTERADAPQKSAIKFIQVDEPDTELQLFRWKHAAKLSHPHLLRIFESGRCRLGDFDLLYVLMEYAEENLAQFLPQRPLTPAEARDVLAPTLQALGFLHAESLAHGRVKPSNILAIEDQLKLSSDAIFSFAEAPQQSQLASAVTQSAAIAPSLRQPTAYDPPEAAKGAITAAGDIWSLGITLVEALTQRLPVADPSPRQDPVVPETLPAVFLDITRHCLHRDPQKRWTVVEIAARLDPRSVAPSASAAQPAAEPSPAPVAAAAVAGIATTVRPRICNGLRCSQNLTTFRSASLSHLFSPPFSWDPGCSVTALLWSKPLRSSRKVPRPRSPFLPPRILRVQPNLLRRRRLPRPQPRHLRSTLRKRPRQAP